MKFSCILSTAIVCLLVAALVWAAEPVVRSCDILDYGFGHVQGAEAEASQDATSFARARFQVDTQSLVSPVAACDFGFTWSLRGEPVGGLTPVTIRLVLPDGSDMETTVMRAIGGEDTSFFRISDPDTAQRGKYQFTIVWQDKVLAEQAFVIQ